MLTAQEIEELQQENDELKKQNILMQNKVIKVEQIKEVAPPNYHSDMQRLKQLELRCKKLQKFMDYGNISGLQTLIEQFMAYSRTQLKKISIELQMSEYGDSENDILKEFVEYLDHIRQELHSFIDFQEKSLKSPVLNQCEEIMSGIIDDFTKPESFNDLSEAKLKELFYTLQTFRQIIQQYKEENR